MHILVWLVIWLVTFWCQTCRVFANNERPTVSTWTQQSTLGGVHTDRIDCLGHGLSIIYSIVHSKGLHIFNIDAHKLLISHNPFQMVNIWIPQISDDFKFLGTLMLTTKEPKKERTRVKAKFIGTKFSAEFIDTLPKECFRFVLSEPGPRATIITESFALDDANILNNPKLLLEASHVVTEKGMVSDDIRNSPIIKKSSVVEWYIDELLLIKL